MRARANRAADDNLKSSSDGPQWLVYGITPIISASFSVLGAPWNAGEARGRKTTARRKAAISPPSASAPPLATPSITHVLLPTIVA